MYLMFYKTKEGTKYQCLQSLYWLYQKASGLSCTLRLHAVHVDLCTVKAWLNVGLLFITTAQSNSFIIWEMCLFVRFSWKDWHHSCLYGEYEATGYLTLKSMSSYCRCNNWVVHAWVDGDWLGLELPISQALHWPTRMHYSDQVGTHKPQISCWVSHVLDSFDRARLALFMLG